MKIATGTFPIPSGVTTVTVVPVELTTVLKMRVDPNLTVESLVNPAPCIVTVVPPDAGPELGLSDAITGM